MLTLSLAFGVSLGLKWRLGIVQTLDGIGKDGRKGYRIAQKGGVLVLCDEAARTMSRLKCTILCVCRPSTDEEAGVSS
jgi:hypothetical protein